MRESRARVKWEGSGGDEGSRARVKWEGSGGDEGIKGSSEVGTSGTSGWSFENVRSNAPVDSMLYAVKYSQKVMEGRTRMLERDVRTYLDAKKRVFGLSCFMRRLRDITISHRIRFVTLLHEPLRIRFTCLQA